MAINRQTPADQIQGTLITADIYNLHLIGNLTYLLSAITVGTLLPMMRTTDIDEHWLICDGRTVGNAASGGTARANADMETIFKWIWDNSSNTEFPLQNTVGAPISRGVSSSADWAANRRMPIPDMRGRAIIHLDGSAGVVAEATADVMGGKGGDDGWATATSATVAAGPSIPITTNTNMSPYMALVYLICTGV